MPVELVVDLGSPDTAAESRTAAHKPLYQKYTPQTVAEVCGHAHSIAILRELLSTEGKFIVVCHGRAGIGIATAVRLLIAEMGYDVREISASAGATTLCKQLRLNSSNILLQMLQKKMRPIYILRDLDALNRPDRLTVLKHASEVSNYPCIVLSTQEIYQMRCIRFDPPDPVEVLEHLCWIATMEVLEVSLERLLVLSTYPDVRSAICALEARSTFRPDVDAVEPYIQCLHAKEDLPSESIEAVADFSDVFCYMDVAEFQPARGMFLSIAETHLRVSFNVTGGKQTHVARNAQICNRVYQLARACRYINIRQEDMDQVSFLIRKHALSGGLLPFPQTDPNSDLKNRALYTIGKRRCTSTEVRHVRKVLQC